MKPNTSNGLLRFSDLRPINIVFSTRSINSSMKNNVFKGEKRINLSLKIAVPEWLEKIFQFIYLPYISG